MYTHPYPPHANTHHNHMKYTAFRSLSYGFQLGFLVTISGKDNVKYPYSISRKTKLLCVLTLVAFKTTCMMPFIVDLTLPSEIFSCGETLPPP